MIAAIFIVLRVLEFLIIARILLSWFRVDPYNPIIRFLYDITEPILAPIRNLLPPSGMMDLSPLVALVILFVIRTLLRSLLI